MINQSPQQNNIYQVIKSYDNLIIKAYLLARFLIIHQRFLDEIGQYLPEKGKVIDLGCGFGLFSLYYAMQYPDLKILGIDINPKRIKMAKKSACKLSLSNAAFMVCDATALNIRTKVRGVYMLDLIHHIPVSAVRPLLCFLYDVLEPGCRLVIKDVKTKPVYKRIFTHALDVIVTRSNEIHYWAKSDFLVMAENVGFEVHSHSMIDYLPYPHIIYICRKTNI